MYHVYKAFKRQKQFEETKQAAGPESDMVEMLELSDQEFKPIMIIMLSALIVKINSMWASMCNVNRENKRNATDKHTVTWMGMP